MPVLETYKELSIIILGALPVAELNVAIPTAIFGYHFPIWKAYTLAVAGNIAAGILVLLFLKYLVKFTMRRSRLGNRFLTWLFEHTKKRQANHFHHYKYAPVALFIFVAIPTPLSGAWSGALASLIFDIPIKTAALTISAGVAIAGVIVSGLSYTGLLTAQGIF